MKLSNAHKCVTNAHQPDYFVRSELFHGGVAVALDKAKPMAGECVINTQPICESERWHPAKSAAEFAACARDALSAFRSASGMALCDAALIPHLLAALGHHCDENYKEDGCETLFHRWGDASIAYDKLAERHGRDFGQFDAV